MLKFGLAVSIALLGVASVSAQTVGLSPIESLHRALNLTNQQETAWKSYRAQADLPAKAQERRRAAAQMFPTLSAPQRMDLLEAELKQELLDLQQQSRALKAFYATLDTKQQQIFDSQTLPPAPNQQDTP